MGITRLKPINQPTLNMKFVIALFACITMASASYSENYFVFEGEGGINCFPERCEVCQAHFGEDWKIFDCEGQCGLCALCNAATKPIVEVCRYCKDGINDCIHTCNKGKQLCGACHRSCNIAKNLI